jgi:hypothetical protein
MGNQIRSPMAGKCRGLFQRGFRVGFSKCLWGIGCVILWRVYDSKRISLRHLNNKHSPSVNPDIRFEWSQWRSMSQRWRVPNYFKTSRQENRVITTGLQRLLSLSVYPITKVLWLRWGNRSPVHSEAFRRSWPISQAHTGFERCHSEGIEKAISIWRHNTGNSKRIAWSNMQNSNHKSIRFDPGRLIKRWWIPRWYCHRFWSHLRWGYCLYKQEDSCQ